MKKTTRNVLMGVILALAGAAPADARCRPVLKADGYSLTRDGERWRLCGTRVAMRVAGRPAALHAKGRLVLLEFRRSDGRALLRWFDLKRREEDFLQLGKGQRVTRRLFAGRFTYVGVTGRGIVRLGRGFPRGVIDAAGAPASLRRDGLVVRWRSHGESRRVHARTGNELAATRCRAPRYAAARHTTPEAVAYEVRLGTLDYEGVVYGCVPGGPAFRLMRVVSELAIESAAVLGSNGPFALVARRFDWKTSGESLQAFDLRTGARTAAVGSAFSGDLEHAVRSRHVLSPSGAIAFSRRYSTGDGEVVAARDEVATVLDRGPDVDPASLALHGTALTWTRGGAARGAHLP